MNPRSVKFRALAAQSLSAYHDAGLDDCELDDAAIRSFGAEYGVDGLALVERLEQFTQAARRSL